ncbi:MAG: PAS domain S-box protein [Verrucomicrobia bacterium]|nr:PAS domain S-box protein [Verrucomicrobiota bacterium]
MKRQLRVLVVEDSEFDAQVMINLLRRAGYDPYMERVETADSLAQSITTKSWDIILADYNLPEFNALDALKQLQATGLDIPFLIVSGGIGEDIAVAAMKAGAHDYLMKGNLQRLAPAVERELREASIRSERRQAKRALQESEQRYRLLWETSPDAVILMDEGGFMQFVNPAVEEVFGCPPEDLMQKSVSVLQPERLKGLLMSRLEETLKAGAVRIRWRNLETLGLRRGTGEFPMEISMSDMELDGHRRFVCFIRDISERKKAEEELRESQEQFRTAREIQQRLFPKSSPAIQGLEVAGCSYSATAAGGDYYDYLPLQDDQWAVVVGDVSGHGVGPALLMAETRAYLRAMTLQCTNIGEILTRVNSILAEDVGTSRFITLFLARICPRQRLLTYVSAGHPNGYILDRTGKVKHILSRTALPLGRRPTTVYSESGSIPLAPGDLIFLLTDGVEEAAAADDSLFGIDRALGLIRERRDQPATEMVKALYEAVQKFAAKGPNMDDLTALVMRVKDSG